MTNIPPLKAQRSTFLMANTRRKYYDARMDVAARKLFQLESTRPSPALHSIIADAVIFAERILQRIDAEWPTPQGGIPDRK